MSASFAAVVMFAAPGSTRVAGKVLQQVIEGLNLETGTYTLSWSGTAQGKIGAGSYGASGITGSITGGINTTIEFGPGTLSKVQLEFGSTATAFEQRPFGLELTLCQRYYEKLNGAIYGSQCTALNVSTYATWQFKVQKRATPTITLVGSNSSGSSSTSVDLTDLFMNTAANFPTFGAGSAASAEL